MSKSSQVEAAFSAELLIELPGERFVYAGQAIAGNSRQALIRTSAPLGVDTEVTIHIPSTGQSAVGRIVSEARELSHFGIELRAPEDFWDSVKR